VIFDDDFTTVPAISDEITRNREFERLFELSKKAEESGSWRPCERYVDSSDLDATDDPLLGDEWLSDEDLEKRNKHRQDAIARRMASLRSNPTALRQREPFLRCQRELFLECQREPHKIVLHPPLLRSTNHRRVRLLLLVPSLLHLLVPIPPMLPPPLLPLARHLPLAPEPSPLLVPSNRCLLSLQSLLLQCHPHLPHLPHLPPPHLP
jgi:hypothetical protein